MVRARRARRCSRSSSCSGSTRSTRPTSGRSRCSLPNIRDHFGLDNADFLLDRRVCGLVLGLLLSVPVRVRGRPASPRLPIVIARRDRVRHVLRCSTGLATTIWMLVIARAGAGFGTAVSTPTHNSLLADYYDIPARPKVYSVHRAALAVGRVPRPAARRAPDVLVQLASAVHRLHRPDAGLRAPRVLAAGAGPRPLRARGDGRRRRDDRHRGRRRRRTPSRGGSCWNVGTLRRIFYALPFLAVAFIGLEIFGSLFYEQVFHLNAARPRLRLRARRARPQLIGLLLTHAHHHPALREERDARPPLRRRRRRRGRGRVDRVRPQPRTSSSRSSSTPS